MDLNAVMQTRGKQEQSVQPERLSPEAPVRPGDAIVRAHGNANHERAAEMTALSRMPRLITISRGSQQNLNGGRPRVSEDRESLVIDSNAEMPTRAKQANDAGQAERLSPETPLHAGGAIVRSHGNRNRERLAEMTSPELCSVTDDRTLSASETLKARFPDSGIRPMTRSSMPRNRPTA
jgi:hypothetical protein